MKNHAATEIIITTATSSHWEHSGFKGDSGGVRLKRPLHIKMHSGFKAPLRRLKHSSIALPLWLVSVQKTRRFQTTSDSRGPPAAKSLLLWSQTAFKGIKCSSFKNPPRLKLHSGFRKHFILERSGRGWFDEHFCPAGLCGGGQSMCHGANFRWVTDAS
ncbi:hypothetical protein Nepgr_002662 [Nepenthes gracilis]|uniref:Uncharacterized protein n=1 Tax=Nepenthes gracilis TaxID=150966 RepID=A0AAD3P7D9_NEPGR|nr:hypothetical protein Nepgr_002662 [Nepenthes gracilis]